MLCPRPNRVEVLNVDGRLLSVRLSVCPLPDPNSRTEDPSTLKIGKKDAHETCDP